VILTVTPNAAVDKTYRVEGFRLDRVHRPSKTHTVAGGKGINVARVYQTLGGQAVCTGFLGGPQGQIVLRALAAERIAGQFVPCAGETRICIAVVDPEAGTQTEINEPGPSIDPREVSQLLRRVQSLLSQQAFEFVVLSGSLPPGAPETLFAELVAMARSFGVKSVLDTSGGALREGLAARPWMVKPNRAELESLGGPLEGEGDLFERARRIQAAGVVIAAVTLGAEGAVLLCGDRSWRAVPPKVEFASAVASGDAFLAAFLWAWTCGERRNDPETALRLATGAGAANAAVVGAGFCSRDAIFLAAQAADIIEV